MLKNPREVVGLNQLMKWGKMDINFNEYVIGMDGEIIRQKKEVFDDDDKVTIKIEKLTIGIVCRGALGNRDGENELKSDKIMHRYLLAVDIAKAEKDKEVFDLDFNDASLIKKLVTEKYPIFWAGFVCDYLKKADQSSGHNKKKKKEI